MSAISRIVFFGTPRFALPTLAALVAAGRAPQLVVTPPDRPAGRGRALHAPPVALFARQHGLALAQEASVRSPAFVAALAAVAPDLAVVVAFGQIFSAELLALPRLGCVNLHASLLPRWRGAAPIQAAVAAGDESTGVTTMRMERGLDSGPVLLQRATPIGSEETAGELSARLAELGAALMLETIAGLERGTLVAQPQPAQGVTLAPKLASAPLALDWNLPSERLGRELRAALPAPGAVATLDGRSARVLRARPLGGSAAGAAPGTLLGFAGDLLAVACGAGSVLGLAELQRPGRRALPARLFAQGERLRLAEWKA